VDFLVPALISLFRRRCRDSAEAEDLAQDVILRTLNRRWSNLEEAKGYVFRTAANICCDCGRRQSSNGKAEIPWDENIVSSVSAGISVERLLLSEEELHSIAIMAQRLG
jgi:DNA-directed RNA polymerase specialized sigma24 family protein